MVEYLIEVGERVDLSHLAITGFARILRFSSFSFVEFGVVGCGIPLREESSRRD